MEDKMKYNWVGHSKTGALCIITMQSPEPLSKIRDSYKGAVVHALCKWNVLIKWGFVANLLDENCRVYSCNMDYFDAHRGMQTIIKDKEACGFVNILSSSYTGSVVIDDVVKYLENDEVKIRRDEILIEEVVCKNNVGMQKFFDLDMTYLLKSPMLKKDFCALNTLSDTIDVFDKFGQIRAVPMDKFYIHYKTSDVFINRKK